MVLEFLIPPIHRHPIELDTIVPPLIARKLLFRIVCIPPLQPFLVHM